MVTCAMAVPANNPPTSDVAIAHRSVFIVRDLSINRNVDVWTECVRTSSAAGGRSTSHGPGPHRVKLISVTIATHRDSEKPGLNRKSRKSAPNRVKHVENGKLCRLHRLLGACLAATACGHFEIHQREPLRDNFVKVKDTAPAGKTSGAVGEAF